MIFVINGRFKIEGSVAAMSVKTGILTDAFKACPRYIGLILPMRSRKAFIWVWSYLNGETYKVTTEVGEYLTDRFFPVEAFNKPSIILDPLWASMSLSERLDVWYYFKLFDVETSIMSWWWNSLFYALQSPSGPMDLNLVEQIYRELPAEFSPPPVAQSEIKSEFDDPKRILKGSYIDEQFISLFPVDRRLDLIPPSLKGEVRPIDRIYDHNREGPKSFDVVMILGMMRAKPLIVKLGGYESIDRSWFERRPSLSRFTERLDMTGAMLFTLIRGRDKIYIAGARNHWFFDLEYGGVSLYPEYTPENPRLDDIAIYRFEEEKNPDPGRPFSTWEPQRFQNLKKREQKDISSINNSPLMVCLPHFFLVGKERLQYRGDLSIMRKKSHFIDEFIKITDVERLVGSIPLLGEFHVRREAFDVVWVYINSGYSNLSAVENDGTFITIWEYIRYFNIPLWTSFIDEYLSLLAGFGRYYARIVDTMHSIPPASLITMARVQRSFDIRLLLATYPGHQAIKDLFTYPYSPIYGIYEEVKDLSKVKVDDVAVFWNSVKYKLMDSEKAVGMIVYPEFEVKAEKVEDVKQIFYPITGGAYGRSFNLGNQIIRFNNGIWMLDSGEIVANPTFLTKKQ